MVTVLATCRESPEERTPPGPDPTEEDSVAETPPLPPPDTSITLTFAGDLMSHPPNFRTSDYARIYEGVKTSIGAADLSFINLEFVVDPDRPMSGYPRFNVHRSYVQAAIDAGFDVFSLANNHTADFADEGIEATSISLSEIRKTNAGTKPIWYSGLGTPGAWKTESIEVRDVRIGFISISMISNEWRSRDKFFLADTAERRESFLSWVKDEQELYDIYVVSVHGGSEYVLEPNQEKRGYLERIAAAGVEIVWAHHPHVLQPFAYTRPGAGRLGTILFSTGNFVSGQTWFLTPNDHSIRRAYTGDSALYQVELGRIRGTYSVRTVTPKLISHYIDEGDVVVRYLEELARLSSSHPWADYYRRRALAMEPFATTSELVGFSPFPEEAVLLTRE